MFNYYEFENAASFEELYEKMKTKDSIPGSRSAPYAPGEMRLIIERVRHGHRPLLFVTRTFGIRAAVERLLETDRVYHKYTKGSRAKKGRN